MRDVRVLFFAPALASENRIDILIFAMAGVARGDLVFGTHGCFTECFGATSGVLNQSVNGEEECDISAN